MVISVGVDVSKDKHDCFIVSSEGEILADVFTIPNTMDGFHCLLQRIRDCTAPQDKIKVGLEATGHYSYNLLGFLLDNGLATYVLNPLRTNLYRKSLSLRKTKTDRVDARTIASMLLSDAGLKPYTDTAYHNEELKSLTRYRFDKVKERAKLKSSIARLICILFPELEKLVPSLHIVSVYALLEEFPGAKQIAAAHLTRLKALLETASKGHYKRDMALEIREAARNSIGSRMPAKSLELQHTIRLIRELNHEIAEIEEQIQSIMDELHSPSAMDRNIIVSIFMVTYNRKEIVVNKIKELLKIQSNEFNVYVLDDASSDGTVDALQQIKDLRLYADRNSERKGILKDGAMPNWYRLLEMCNGIFALHLNDRDLIDSNGVVELIDFLKVHPTLTGAIRNLTGRVQDIRVA